MLSVYLEQSYLAADQGDIASAVDFRHQGLILSSRIIGGEKSDDRGLDLIEACSLAVLASLCGGVNDMDMASLQKLADVKSQTGAEVFDEVVNQLLGEHAQTIQQLLTALHRVGVGGTRTDIQAWAGLIPNTGGCR